MSRAAAPTQVILLLVCLAVCACALLFQSPYNASHLDTVPDSVEYATGALRLVTHGTYDITINGVSFPPRYPPWFSTFILAPAYRLLGPEPGNGVIPVLIFALAGVGAAFHLGRSVSGYAGGWLAAVLVLSLRLYTRHAKDILTDVPVTAIALMLCLLFVRLRSSAPRPPGGALAAAALLVCLSAALRPATATMALPFLLLPAGQTKLRKLFVGALFLLPPLALGLTQAVYNVKVFGAPLRNGYNFWCPVPYDYPRLVFGVSYIRSNLGGLLASGVVVLAALIVLLHVLVRRARLTAGTAAPMATRSYRSIWLFTAIGLGPLFVLHLVYFYPDGRFFLPVSAMLAAMAGALGGVILNQVSLRTIVLVQAGFAVLTVGFRCVHQPKLPERRVAADAIRESAPAGSIVITGIDPVYLGTMLGDQSRCFIVPISRRVEYASKLVARRRIETLDPQPEGWRDHRCLGLVRGGAVDVIATTAAENPSWVVNAVKEGKPVFLSTVDIPPEDAPVVAHLRATFVAAPVGWQLFRLTLPPT